MGKRRAARELALKFLYQTEFNPDDREAQMEQFCERADTHHEITEFMKVLVDKVFSQSEEVNSVTIGRWNACPWSTGIFCV